MVKKVKVSKIPKKIERLPSGINGFDKLCEGGFENNSINLIVGSSGSGKTIFTMQFLMGGISRGENVLYVTFEEKKGEFYSNMREFGWDLEKEEKSGKFTFLEYSPEKVRMMLDEGGGEIESIVSKKKITRMVIDSISSFALLFNEELARREAALALFSIIRKWECACLLTLQEDPISRKTGASSSLEFEADSIILIYFLMGDSKRKRFLEILKMRGTNHSIEIREMNITKKGVTVGNKTSIRGFLN